MNLPNLLSLFRLFITAFFIVLISYQQFRLALLLFIVQALSDLLDGFLARRMDAKTSLGAYLDPLADKVMLASSYLVLMFQKIIPAWLVVTVLVRDLIITLGFFLLTRRTVRLEPVPTMVSKTTTVFQMLTVVYVLWSTERAFDSMFFYATALLTAVSGIQYIMVGFGILFRKEIV
jgi:cardiolipin synthase (CMP-forming)